MRKNQLICDQCHAVAAQGGGVDWPELLVPLPHGLKKCYDFCSLKCLLAFLPAYIGKRRTENENS